MNGGSGSALAARLRELRVATGLTGAAFARRAGWSQSKVSKIENGRRLPSSADVTRWLELADADADQCGELRLLRETARADLGRNAAPDPHASWVDRYAQRVRQDLDLDGFREFQPAGIPVVVQTREHLAEVLGRPSGLVDPADAGTVDTLRIQHRDLFYRESYGAVVVLGEAALYHHPGTRATMVDQLRRMREMLDLPSLDLRILPFGASATAPLPHGFVVYPDSVQVELLHDAVRSTAPDVVAWYGTLMDRLLDLARTGDDGRALIDRACAWHARQPDP